MTKYDIISFMKAKVIETIRKYDMISLGETVVLAVSGGVDSMVLMHIFAKLAKDFELTLIVAHLDHQRRADSALDSELVCRVAKLNGFIFEQDVLPKQGKAGNFQAYARAYRYDFFKRIAKKYGATKVATAHHTNDHLETIIDRMMSSETSASLIGIQPVGVVDEMTVIRPLIEMEKDDIYKYAKDFSVDFREDASNSSDAYLRNRIRKKIVPPMKHERADIFIHARNLSDNLQLDESYFNSKVDELMKEVKVSQAGYELSFSWLQALHASLRRRLLLRLIPTISKGAMLSLAEFLDRGTASGIYDVGCRTVVKKSYDKVLIVSSGFKDFQLGYEVELVVNAVNKLPDGRKIVVKQGFNEKSEKNEAQGTYLCYNGIRMPLMVRSRRSGDLIQLVNRHGRAKVKKIMIDAKIPVDERENWPIVVDADGKLVWIPGLKKSPACLAKPNSSKDLWLQIYE